jgi:hypothetical protein
MDELQETVETLIDLDEPEALLETLKRAAAKKPGERWRKLAKVLSEAEANLTVTPRVHEGHAPSEESAAIAEEAKAE